MENIKQMLAALYTKYLLVQITDGRTMVDFDDESIYLRELDVDKFEVVEYGVKIGILDKYEDELYYIDQSKVDAVKEYLTSIEDWYVLKLPVPEV